MVVNRCSNCGEEYNYYEDDTPSKFVDVCSDGCYDKVYGGV